MRYIFYSLLLIITITGACKRYKVPTEGLVNATVIDYKVEYLEEKAGSIPTSILPSKMTLIFADRFALNRIDGFLGQFSLIYIANLKTGSVTTMMKLFDKKYYYPGKAGELPCGINEIKGLKISETGKTKEISGFAAKELRANSVDKDNFYIYTAKIDHIKNPNLTTPYSKVDDVLLEFFTSLSLMEMKLNATRVYNKEVDWALFNIPADYVQISRLEMEKTIAELFR